MTVHNMEIANAFNRLANFLEIDDANPFRVRAYRHAARTISSLSKDVADLILEGQDLTELPGIGKDLAEKIKTLVKTGELPLLKEIESHHPAILSELMQIEGLGPKRIQVIYKKLKIKNMSDLKNSIVRGHLRELHGFGKKIEQKILQGMLHHKKYTKRILLSESWPIVNSIIHYIKKIKGITAIECAGSFRRRKETIGDLDILVAAEHGEKVIHHFIHFNEVAEILSQGTTRSTVRLHSGIQVDLRVVKKKSYGAALVYFTGSKEHNIVLRKMAVQKKLKINEYGVFKNKTHIAGRTEKEIYAAVGLPYIEPELREDRGEIEAAKKNQLPHLIELNDILGDLHCHTALTDGEDSLAIMAKAAFDAHYEYLAITDHSKHLTIAHGLDKKAVLKQIKLIDKINAKSNKFVILKSIEVDILEDGSLDLQKNILKELDLTVCSIHSKFNLSQTKQTERILRAMDNPYFNILAHPTGRLINQRESFTIDLEKIMFAAKERGCILELNAQPKRLDLNDIHCKMAKSIGVKIAISSDAHSTNQLSHMQCGLYQARRGWLEKNDVINTLPIKALKKILHRS